MIINGFFVTTQTNKYDTQIVSETSVYLKKKKPQNFGEVVKKTNVTF